MRKRALQLVLTVMALTLPYPLLADHQLPNQPKATDGGYIVLWDCANSTFASANTMEWDQTFVFAIDVSGTELGEWVKRAPSTAGMVRGVGADIWRFNGTNREGKQYPGQVSRLWHIQGDIWGATYNFAQMGVDGYNPSNGEQTKIGIRLFGFESPLGTTCTTGQPATGRWWIGQGEQYTWMQGFTAASGVQHFFQFAKYTGTKKDPMPAKLVNSISYDDAAGAYVDASANVYLDKGGEAVHNYKVIYNGYASPWSTRSGACYMPYVEVQHYAISASRTEVCSVTNTKATLTLAGSETGVTYYLYQDGTEVSGSNKAGTGSPLKWEVGEEGSYYVVAKKAGGEVRMNPCTGASEVTLTTSSNCCSIQNVVITVSNGNPGMDENITVKATVTGDNNEKKFSWEIHGAGDDKGALPSSITPTSDGKTYSQFEISYTQWKDIAGAYAEGSGKNNGYYTFWCVVSEKPDQNCEQNGQQQVHVKKELICPNFTWAIDGTEGLATPMYPGGWYDISVSTESGAPAPTLTISGTGVTVVGTPTTSGNKTTARIELSGTATGDITLKANTAANSAAGYKACEDIMTPTIADCDGMTKDSYKIQWTNYDGYPDWQIHGGADVFLRDNNGVLEADIAHTDGMDEWNLIYTGQKYNGQDSIFYVQNALTRRYLYRGNQHGKVGDGWEYAEALLSSTNTQTDAYKWIFHHFVAEGKSRIIMANIDGYTGTDANIKNGAYIIHNRNWEAPEIFTNPNIKTPRMVCGKSANEGLVSPSFRLKNFIKTQVEASNAHTTLSWDGTAPAAEVKMVQGGTCTYTAKRTDDMHSINRAIHYETKDASVATINATTGLVTAVAEDGETEIMAILEDIGCFLGDTLIYKVKIYECGEVPAISTPKTVLAKNETVQLTINPSAGTGETGTWEFTRNDGNNATISAAGVFSATNTGTYQFYYKITNAAHPDCNRQSNGLTIEVKEKEDYILPDQPIAADGTYVVLWDCEKNDFADANTMEWGETFVFAVNLHGTPLGNWVMQQPSQAGAVRTIAFDRFIKKYGDDNSEHFDLDVSRLWLIRDTIFGATYNFEQIPFRNGQTYKPTNGEKTGIAVRLFGVEAALGDKCGNTPSVSKWWQWSNNSTYSEWKGEWQEGKYVSEDDEYLFHFAPYTGQSDPIINSANDDIRDRWFDGGHDFNKKGYLFPCPKPRPTDQVVSIDKQTICDKESETATLTVGGSETDWEYSLYKDGTFVSTQAGTGAALTWTLTEAGTYTVEATAKGEGYDDRMGSCTTKGERTLTIHCEDEPEPVCPETEVKKPQVVENYCDTLLPYKWTTYRDITINKEGTYKDTLRCTLSNGVQCDSVIYELQLTVRHCEPEPEECVDGRIYRKWNDLLLVDNADQRYVSYQWYCDGKAITDATGQYLYTEGIVLQGDGHVYYCVVTMAAGGQETLCSNKFEDFPTAVGSGRQPAKSVMRIYSPTGKLLYSGKEDAMVIQSLRAGIYLLYRETEEGENITEKLIIY